MHFTLEHIRHGVVTRLTPIQEECCLYSAIGKHTAALGHMADGHNLFRAAEQHIMVAHNAAAAHGADAQFLRAALLAHSVAVIDILIFAAKMCIRDRNEIKA